jgi:NADPH-dependent glutamate synthase beta subunit-like oxidoreductase
MAISKNWPDPDGTCWTAFQKMPPCQAACPIHMDVSGYVLAIAQGRFQDALDIMRETNPLPGVCGRVCHHPCEAQCVRGKLDEPIAIQWLKRFPADLERQKGIRKPQPAPRLYEERVAIVGSGPAGLTAAHDLAKLGYEVTIFEALPVAGGMLAYGVPEFGLDRKVVEAEVDYIRSLGVEIKLNHQVGPNLTMNDLRQMGYKAILLAVGAQDVLKLKIPGTDLQGVYHGLPLIRDASLGQGPKLGGRVAVIGGGNVAIDAARVALRLGASEVHVTCLEADQDMPAFPWEIEKARQEGIVFHPCRSPQRIVDKSGKVAGVDFVGVKSIGFDSEGRIKPELDESEKESLPADAVIIAIGQGLDRSFLAGDGNIRLGKKGEVLCDPDTLATDLEGIFVAGDAVVLRGTVVEAMAAGRKAADSIHRYLRGQNLKGNGAPLAAQEINEAALPRFLEPRRRQPMPTLDAGERIRSNREVELGFSEREAVAEARRCLTCDVCGNCMFDRAQVCFETGSRLL